MREFSNRDLLKSLDNLESIESFGSIAVNKSSNEYFNLDNINYFDLFYKSKFVDIIFIIKYIDKSTFFYNIYIFINKVKNTT